MLNVAECGKRDVLTVKAADRLCNTKDFISLKGHLYAFRYLHSADCLLPALEKFRNDPVIGNALNDWKKLDDALRTKARQDAIRGCLLGGAVGDALGSPVEFLSLSSIKRIYGDTVKDYVEFDDNTGAITDDTQMTLFTAEGLLRAITRGEKKGICDGVKVVANAYARWLKTQGITANVPENVLTEGWLIKEKALYQCRAPGNTCLSALEAGNIPAKNSSKGCGTVM
ncbi:MAG: ADP-ribosylglycohydrolase family protein, partial [Lentisphaeria bacterium]|nr:ADP-ribosylglycohydrolase family protein [Lentisphaeria bacterium]